MASNQYESAARQGKAFKMAMHLRKSNITADEAGLMTPYEWGMVALLADCKWDPTRNHDETIALTLQKLTALAAAGDQGVSAGF